MSAPKHTPETLSALLRSYHSSDSGPDHEEILKHANNVLRTSAHRGDSLALHTKAVALLQLDRHEDALKIFESAEGKKLDGVADLEHAYCLYKVGKLNEAVELAKRVEGATGKGRGMRYISAQAHYRLENFEEAANICKSLADGHYEAPNEDGDLRVNTAAIEAQLAWAGKLTAERKTSREDMEIFEGCFNAACISIARGDYGAAAVLLKRARQLCEALEDLTEEEKEAELEPVMVQELYLYAQTGQTEKALELASTFDSDNVYDEALRVISAINSQCVFSQQQAEDYNPFLAWKKYHSAVSKAKSLAARPFSFQARLLHYDESVFDLALGKTNGAQKKATEHHNLYPTDRTSSVVNAAAQTAEEAGRAVEKKIDSMFKKNQKDIGLALTLVQLRMDAGNVSGAIDAMDALFANLEDSFKYQPGLVGLLASLYAHQGRKKHTRDLLGKASEYWLSQPAPNPSILRAAGKAKLHSDDPADLASAGELFSALLKSDPKDRISTAGLVASYATSDPAKVSSYIESLTPVATLTADIDVDALEAAGVAQPPRKRGAEEERPRVQEQKTRKKKKPRLPKDYDPEKKVDPERWLPMRDRSYYKPKGKKDKKKAAAATQGGAVTESMELAGGGRVDVKIVGGGQKKPQGGQKKGKKKGKK